MEGSTRKGSQDISQTVTSKKEEESLKQMKTICKKISVSILTLLMIMTMYLSGSGESLFLKNRDVKAFTGEAKLVMSQALSSNKISEIDRPASEGLWSMTADGHRVFCLNSGKTMCSGDTLKYKTINAATYEKKGIAKALNCYFRSSGKNTKDLSLCQAYIWACGHGANKQNTVYQAGKNVDRGYSQKDAKKFCKMISDQDPEGTIYYYTVKKCVKKKKLDSHQVLFGFRHTPPDIEKAKTSATKSGTSPDNVRIKIKKKDAETRAGLSGAVFQIYMDGNYQGSVTTDDNGEASYTVQRTVSYSVTSTKKTYVKNWNDLSKSQQKEATDNGWYDSSAKAYAVAMQEAQKLAKQKISALKSASVHTWMVRETKSPFGHLIPDQTDQSKVEQGGARSFTFNYTNEFQKSDLEIFKQGTVKNKRGDLGVEANLQNAVYELYADHDITGSDNKSVVYKAGTLVTQMVTDANGYAKVTDLYPGYYRLHEKYAPLGYKKHPDIKGKLLIDDETKWIIEKIFSLAYQGYGSAKITKQLRAEKVPTASWLNFTRYGTFAHIFEGKPESKRYEWTIAHVKAILKSEVYIGNSVHNMQSTVSFKSKKKVRKPESEWFRVENTHEPIIDKEVFYRVQEQIKSRRRQTKEKATPIFAGLVKCADCGWSMRLGTNKANKTPYSYYACSYYGQFGKGNCSMHYIRYDVLYQAVLERLQYWAKAVQQDEEKVLNKIQKAGNAERIREKKKKASTLKKAENRQNEIDRLFAKMYEDRACEKITERNFVMLSSKYQKEQIELEQQITSLREELSKMEQDMIGAEKWIELIKEYSVPKELTAPLLNAMIEKILIHEATTNEDNERIQEIEIYYRFIGRVE